MFRKKKTGAEQSEKVPTRHYRSICKNINGEREAAVYISDTPDSAIEYALVHKAHDCTLETVLEYESFADALIDKNGKTIWKLKG